MRMFTNRMVLQSNIQTYTHSFPLAFRRVSEGKHRALKDHYIWPPSRDTYGTQNSSCCFLGFFCQPLKRTEVVSRPDGDSPKRGSSGWKKCWLPGCLGSSRNSLGGKLLAPSIPLSKRGLFSRKHDLFTSSFILTQCSEAFSSLALEEQLTSPGPGLSQAPESRVSRSRKSDMK